MHRSLPWLALLVGLLGAVAGLFVTCDTPREHPVAPPRTAPPGEAVSDAEDEESRDLAWLDNEIAGRTARGEAGSWVDYELVAQRYLARQRITGDYADFSGAEHALERAFALAPEGGGPVFTRMRLSFTLHRLGALREDLARTEGSVFLHDEAEAVAAYRADLAFYSGLYDEALTRYEAQLAQHRSAENLVALSQYRWRTGDLAGADALIAEAEAQANSAGTLAWLSLVRALFEISQDHWDAAQGALEHGLTLSPGWWQLEEHMAQVLFEQGALGDARLLYESVFERTHSPESLDALAIIASEEGRTEDARQLTERARELHEARIALFPEAAAGHALDHFLVLEDDLARAIELAELNRDARPFGEAQGKLAIAYARAGRWDDALEVVYLLEGTPWSTGESRAISALVHEQVGDAARAAAHRAAAIALSPTAVDRVVAILRGR